MLNTMNHLLILQTVPLCFQCEVIIFLFIKNVNYLKYLRLPGLFLIFIPPLAHMPPILFAPPTPLPSFPFQPQPPHSFYHPPIISLLPQSNGFLFSKSLVYCVNFPLILNVYNNLIYFETYPKMYVTRRDGDFPSWFQVYSVRLLVFRVKCVKFYKARTKTVD